MSNKKVGRPKTSNLVDFVGVPISKEHREYLMRVAGHGDQASYIRSLIEKDMESEKGT